MYMYVNPQNKTYQMFESGDIFDVIAITNGKGAIYLTKDNDDEDASDYSEDEIKDLMSKSVAWKDGNLSDLGRTIINNPNFRNYID